jgi:predicted nucleotidyltransferase
MKVEKDYEDLLELLNRHNVKYCIIGSYALAFHARPRYTKDIDILIENSIVNARKILKALNEFGFGSLQLTEEDFTEPRQIIQLGYEPVRVDLITSIKGIDFHKIWENRVTGKFGSQTVFFIGAEDLMAAKKISNRSQDQTDLKILGEFVKRRNKTS